MMHDENSSKGTAKAAVPVLGGDEMKSRAGGSVMVGDRRYSVDASAHSTSVATILKNTAHQLKPGKGSCWPV